MPLCPKCQKEINHLIDWSKVSMKYVFRLDSTGIGDYEETGMIEAMDILDDYECPECWEVLFHQEEKAAAFLTGEEHLDA